MLELRSETSAAWVAACLADFDVFLRDHAANERKVAQSALRLVTQHPKRRELVAALIDVAVEELEHFRLVYGLLAERGQDLGFEQPDPYIKELNKALRKRDVEEFLLDRLLLFGIIEARGCERFGLIADAFALRTDDEGRKLSESYRDLQRSEARHHGLYQRLARLYFPAELIAPRVAELLQLEADVLAAQPLRAALH
ncbi:MAG: tRNA-(ms[2]io[6]A)-hydroxylase [Proteobacteria bacterium]|nr:MAG: tRNA-(ms[2]io[6]A)-hydroxylase [Pseudomonadota bacterium]